MRKRWLALIALVGFQVPGANASTVDFDVTVSCPTCIITSGTITDVTTPLGGDRYRITSILGDLGGFPVTLLAPGTYLANDNILYFPPTPALFDVFGVGMSIDGEDTKVACIFTACGVIYPDPNTIAGIHPATFTVTQTPLPAALALFATGLGALGLLGWSKRWKSAAALASN